MFRRVLAHRGLDPPLPRPRASTCPRWLLMALLGTVSSRINLDYRRETSPPKESQGTDPHSKSHPQAARATRAGTSDQRDDVTTRTRAERGRATVWPRKVTRTFRPTRDMGSTGRVKARGNDELRGKGARPNKLGASHTLHDVLLGLEPVRKQEQGREPAGHQRQTEPVGRSDPNQESVCGVHGPTRQPRASDQPPAFEGNPRSSSWVCRSGPFLERPGTVNDEAKTAGKTRAIQVRDSLTGFPNFQGISPGSGRAEGGAVRGLVLGHLGAAEDDRNNSTHKTQSTRLGLRPEGGRMLCPSRYLSPRAIRIRTQFNPIAPIRPESPDRPSRTSLHLFHPNAPDSTRNSCWVGVGGA
jgi:hypothetical protein